MAFGRGSGSSVARTSKQIMRSLQSSPREAIRYGVPCDLHGELRPDGSLKFGFRPQHSDGAKKTLNAPKGEEVRSLPSQDVEWNIFVFEHPRSAGRRRAR